MLAMVLSQLCPEPEVATREVECARILSSDAEIEFRGRAKVRKKARARLVCSSLNQRRVPIFSCFEIFQWEAKHEVGWRKG